MREMQKKLKGIVRVTVPAAIVAGAAAARGDEVQSIMAQAAGQISTVPPAPPAPPAPAQLPQQLLRIRGLRG